MPFMNNPTVIPTLRNSARLLLAALLLAGCTLVSPYSETAYRQAVELKVESSSLMAKATEPYLQHQAAAESLILDAYKAREYARGRPKNDESIQQWDIMLNPTGHMLGGFMERWKAQGGLSPAFVQEARSQVEKGFDQIIALESGKSK